MQDARSVNPKFEARNPKWFGQLTILSQVEGQIQMTKIKTFNHEVHEEIKNDA